MANLSKPVIFRFPGTPDKRKFKALPCSGLLAFCLLLAAGLHGGRPATAQTAAPLPPLTAADAYFADLFHRSESTGMVVVVVRDHDTWMQSYGQTFPGSHQKPNADSLLRLCSLSKIMTTDVLVKLIAEGKIALKDPLQKYAPVHVSVPVLTVHGQSGPPLTIGNLATHTAGLPREIAYPTGDAGHFTFPDYAFRWQWLPGYRLKTPPGTAAHYSNIGFDLLADAMARAAGKPYPQLLAEQTTRPLGLRDTTVTPTPGQCARLMVAAKDGGHCSDTTAASGSGGVYSTAGDMARWLKYLLALPGVPVHQDPKATATYIPVSQLKWTQGMSRAGAPTGIGLGWVHINQPEDPAAIIEKTGGGAGFNTYIALNPARHIGLFVAATDGRHEGASIFPESNALLIYLAGLTPVPEEPLKLSAAPKHAAASPQRSSVVGKRSKSGRRTHAARRAPRRTVLSAVHSAPVRHP